MADTLTTELAAHVPIWVRRLLVVGGTPERVTEVLPHSQDPQRAVRSCLTEALGHLDVESPYDAVIVQDLEALCSDSANLAAMATALSADGYVIAGLMTSVHGADGAATIPDGIQAALAPLGLGVYQVHPVDDGSVLVLVRATYNPVEHAHARFGEGRADDCFAILDQIPETYLRNPEVAATIYADMQYCLAVPRRGEEPNDKVRRFFEAQVLFYRAVSRVPTWRDAYHTQAELWQSIGDPDMGRRLLRSIEHAAPSPETAQALASWPGGRSDPRPIVPPEWSGAVRPRVLMIVTPGRPHYGMDVLYDGLCTVLGHDHVIEFPWKPTLHGRAATSQANYPCLFNRPGEPMGTDTIAGQLRDGLFDVVLFSDLEHEVDTATARSLANAAHAISVFAVDVQDDPIDHWHDIEAFLDRPLAGYFKREMLACREYHAHTYPLPFAYPDGLVPDTTPDVRAQVVFWAGHRRFGLRRLYLEHVERLLGQPLDRDYAPGDYVRAIENARIGLNIFGFGYDTVRYWEIPAHGAMLLSERLPIRVPYDFEDGHSAMFFDDLKDLEDKLAYYGAHREASAAIAAAGHAHLRRFHTGSARARQLLGWIEAAAE
ncbi:MAG TPA: glycosyltransferase [Candidatus Hydrogenedentes bacterium]|nr:glycosyltransferase [Candidatus Hydrogenedentota bacterium]